MLYCNFQILNHGIPASLMDRVKKVCSHHFKNNREHNFNQSLPVKILNEALKAEANGKNPGKADNVDWEDVFQVHEMEDTNSWPSEPSDFKCVLSNQFSILLTTNYCFT